MEKDTVAIPENDPWHDLRHHTPARIALGRCGSSLPTRAVLRFGAAHAAARDAVHTSLDVATLRADANALSSQIIQVHSKAPDRATYLLRPDFGRRLAPKDAQKLIDERVSPCDLLFVIGDGLSASAVQRHAVPLLKETIPLLTAKWVLGPIVIAEQARVAIGDEIGGLLHARIVVMMIGERPGLSSPDSLGIYITHSPKVGIADASRNCISNIRPEGLPYSVAARKLAWLLSEALHRGITGTALKENEASTCPAVAGLEGN